MGEDCDHGDACPARVQQAAADICHTGGHDDPGSSQEVCGGMYIGCNDKSPDVMNALEIPLVVNNSSPDRAYALSGEIPSRFAGTLDPFASSSKEPPESTLFS